MQLLQDDTDGGGGSSSYVRGTTVCLAALGKSKTANDSGEVGVCNQGLPMARYQHDLPVTIVAAASVKTWCASFWLPHQPCKCKTSSA